MQHNRLCQLRNLLFFCLVLLFSCAEDPKNISIIWEANKAKAVLIPNHLVKEVSASDINNAVSIRKENDTTTLLGYYHFQQGLLFEPLIPFQRGASYTVSVLNKNVAKFYIPLDNKHTAPQVVAVYPQSDTLPENTLKLYIEFSQPMREGESLQHIKLVNHQKDTLPGTFLDLQPELWNENRTVITVWFDPGRIKRNLQPNLSLGAPLQPNARYQLVIAKNWQDAEGTTMKQDVIKSFVTGVRDSLLPDPQRWKIAAPKAASKEPLTVYLDKALDHFLLLECLQVTDQKGNMVKGKFAVSDEDRSCYFTPEQNWTAGKYTLLILSKLEDLAGNNLNKAFDRDIANSKKPSTQEYYTRNFIIE
jgi:hypothetical protein